MLLPVPTVLFKVRLFMFLLAVKEIENARNIIGLTTTLFGVPIVLLLLPTPILLLAKMMIALQTILIGLPGRLKVEHPELIINNTNKKHHLLR